MEIDQFAAKQKDTRVRLLLNLYEGTQRQPTGYAKMADVAASIGSTYEETRHLFHDLAEQGLMKLGAGHTVAMTGEGRRWVEDALTEAEQEQTPEPTHITNNQFNAPVGVAQVGNHNVANVTQAVGDDVRVLFQQLRQELMALDPEKRAEATELADSLEEEATTKKRHGTMKGILAALQALMIGTLSGGSGNILGALALQLLQRH